MAGPSVGDSVFHALPGLRRSAQSTFDQTGGLHGAALFSRDGKLMSSFEDVGRHNALDKLIGHEFLQGRLPLHDSILIISGRISFELMQKAAMAGFRMIAAIGAPSSLAIELAEEMQITLVGFL